MKKERFNEIKKEVSYLLEDYGINKLPIDVFMLAKKMGFYVFLRSHKMNSDDSSYEYFSPYKPESFTIVDSKRGIYIIGADDINYSKNRVRFSLAHEIMHIVLKHSEQNEENESEANFGASYLLAPSCLALIDDLNLLDNVKFVMKTFSISSEAAENIIKSFKARSSLTNYQPSSYEEKIIMLLKNSFNKACNDFFDI